MRYEEIKVFGLSLSFVFQCKVEYGYDGHLPGSELWWFRTWRQDYPPEVPEQGLLQLHSQTGRGGQPCWDGSWGPFLLRQVRTCPLQPGSFPQEEEEGGRGGASVGKNLPWEEEGGSQEKEDTSGCTGPVRSRRKRNDPISDGNSTTKRRNTSLKKRAANVVRGNDKSGPAPSNSSQVPSLKKRKRKREEEQVIVLE